MPPHMMNGMMQQQQMLQMQHMMQAANMPQRHRDAPESEPSAKRPRLDLGSNQGTSLLEAFSAAEIQTHLAMLRSRPGQYLCHGLVAHANPVPVAALYMLQDRPVFAALSSCSGLWTVYVLRAVLTA